MEKDSILSDAKAEFFTILSWVLSGLIEALFILFLVIIQWLLDEYVINRFTMQGVSLIVLSIAQWLFAIATLYPIFLHLLKLVVTMTARTVKSIRKEIENETSRPVEITE